VKYYDKNWAVCGGAPSNAGADSMPSDTSQPCVLLVDDEPANLIALKAVLDRLGARLVEARSGAEALECVERDTFAVVLLDVQMPVMDGFEIATRLRNLPRGREVPILFVTAIHRDQQYAKRGYAVGAADYITKPFDVDVLRARVRSYIDLYRQREEAHRARIESRSRQLDEARRRLEAFEHIASAALESEPLDEFLHSLCTIFTGAADSADTVSILLREGGALFTRASIGVPEEIASDFSIAVGQGFAGRVAADGKPRLLVGEAIADTVQSPWLRARGMRALYGAPLVHDGEVIGVAYIGSTKADSFSAPEMSIFQAMVERASWAVSRKQARGRLYAVLDAAPVAMSVFRAPQFVCEFANEAFRRIWGGGDVVGRCSTELGATPEMTAHFERVIRDGETISLEEFSMTVEKKEGLPDERFFRVSLHPLRNAHGRPEAVLAVSVDLTEEVQTRRALELARKDAEFANRMKDEFLATVAHELRTPVSGILGWTTAARAGAKDPRRALEAIERTARAQIQLLDDMLDIARIASGQLRLDFALTDITRVLLDAVDGVRPAADAKSIELDVRLGQGLGDLMLDGGRIQQIVWNLLSNAAKFTPRGGRVRLSAARSTTTIVVSVTDTGEGITADLLPHIFEPFRQGDTSTARMHRGLGLGLAIAKQLALAHGGCIRAESEGRAKGATFTLELPIRGVPALDPRPRTALPGETVRLDGVNVLVVDDETDALEMVAQVLEAQGARVQRSATVNEALGKMSLFRPDVIVSDLAMPQTDGYALLQNIRTWPAELGGKTPAIALTARVLASERQRAFNAGFEEHIPKPVDPAELVARIALLFARKKLESSAS
jgi:PAS domain S-box-containing protein